MPGASYGMGWFLTKWKDFTVVEHGGNSLGFSANIAFIPSEGIGYVMLSNCLPNPLQQSLNAIVWETFLTTENESHGSQK